MNTEEITTQLGNLALEFNSGNGAKIRPLDDSIDCKQITIDELYGEEETWIQFNCHIFYNFLSQDVSYVNVGRLLDHMKNSINNSMGKNRVDRSTTELQKV